MKNSRRDGILLVDCKKPYKMAIDGQQVDKHRVICRDITNNTEYIAFDLEHYLRLAMFEIPKREEESTQTQAQAAEEDSKAEKFYNNESPTMEEVQEQAHMLEMAVSMTKVIPLSKLMHTFEGLVNGGLIFMEGKIKMPRQIWNQIDRYDKLKIMFNYIAFFVNPLQKLVETSTKTENSSVVQGMIQSNETQSESAF